MHPPTSSRVAVTAAVGATAAAMVSRFRGELRLTVIVKASFAFAADLAMPRVDPQEIVEAEVHHGNNPARTVRLTTDLVPHLERADVVFTGRAHAPPGCPQTSMTVRLGVFSGAESVLDKALRIERAAGFQEMPLVYERAYGGLGRPDNPMGTGADPGSAAPEILDPADRTRPAGFGPIARAWGCRKRLLGPGTLPPLGRALVEIPDDLDWTYFQSAPPDQRIASLRGDEWIVLTGLHPTIPCLRTRLPSAVGKARIHGLAAFGFAEGAAIPLCADTLRIDGVEQRCTVTWRGAVVVPSEDALVAAHVLAGVELPGEPIVWPGSEAATAVAPSPPQPSRPRPPQSETLVPDAGRALSPPLVLPFRAATASPACAAPRGAVAPQPSTGTLVQPFDAALASPTRVLPFRGPSDDAGHRPAVVENAVALPPPDDTVSPADVEGPLPDDEPPAAIAPPPPSVPPAAPPDPGPPPSSARPVSPWSSLPEAPVDPPAAPPAPVEPPAPAAALKKGVYGRYNRRG